jgi:LL-diaminopimelate aminotransferase
MALVNQNYLNLKSSYLFSEIAKRINIYQEQKHDLPLIRMGIGDVTEPLPKVCIKALHDATEEMAKRETFKGYGPEQGYLFLRELISKNDYESNNLNISADEIFISDGSKCDSGNFQELFSLDSRVGIPDPVYPVYLDSNVMAGRSGEEDNGRYSKINYLETSKETGFLPNPPDSKLDIIYLCSPNNPTGAVFTKERLQAWVDYALENKSILLFDAAYYAFIKDTELPRSIYEIPRAREVAVEFRSFSKTAGFTGTRCAFTVVPKECFLYAENNEKISLHALWLRRQSTKFNGVSYPIQKAAAAIYSEEGKKEVQNLINFYLENALIIKNSLESKGLYCIGGDNAPYVWVEIKGDSWEYFDKMLNKIAVVCTPGVGFGNAGRGYVRFSAFNSRENVEEAMLRLDQMKL